MSTTITAHIPGRKSAKFADGRTVTYPARDFTASRDADGRWTAELYGSVESLLESEVIDECRKATNWGEIRAAHFPMHGFGS